MYIYIYKAKSQTLIVNMYILLILQNLKSYNKKKKQKTKSQ